jgi:hypothetical protein
VDHELIANARITQANKLSKRRRKSPRELHEIRSSLVKLLSLTNGRICTQTVTRSVHAMHDTEVQRDNQTENLSASA